MNTNIIIVGIVSAVPIVGVVGTWAVMKYRLNNHSKRINGKADKELVEIQFKAVNTTLCEIREDVRTLLSRKK